jgi:photosystem II stability/assembly factor-like uncharacterized protein
MKTSQIIILIIFLIFYSCRKTESDSSSDTLKWTWQHPLPNGNNLNSIKFVNNSVGYIVGNYGTFLKTTDAGKTWNTNNVNTKQNIVSVYFVSIDTGYSITDCSVYKTVNGGKDWAEVFPCNTQDGFNSIYFIDSKVGFVNGFYTYATYDGGKTWAKLNLGTVLDINFPTKNIGYAVGTSGSKYKTIDGGKTWSHLPWNSSVWYNSVFFTNDSCGFIIGNG